MRIASRPRRACPEWDTGMIAAFYPNGIPSPSPGLTGGTTAYPGDDAANRVQPQRGCVRQSGNLANRDTTPLGLTCTSRCSPVPRVGARTSHQPWALGHIPVGDGMTGPAGAIKSTDRKPMGFQSVRRPCGVAKSLARKLPAAGAAGLAEGHEGLQELVDGLAQRRVNRWASSSAVSTPPHSRSTVNTALACPARPLGHSRLPGWPAAAAVSCLPAGSRPIVFRRRDQRERLLLRVSCAGF